MTLVLPLFLAVSLPSGMLMPSLIRHWCWGREYRQRRRLLAGALRVMNLDRH